MKRFSNRICQLALTVLLLSGGMAIKASAQCIVKNCKLSVACPTSTCDDPGCITTTISCHTIGAICFGDLLTASNTAGFPPQEFVPKIADIKSEILRKTCRTHSFKIEPNGKFAAVPLTPVVAGVYYNLTLIQHIINKNPAYISFHYINKSGMGDMIIHVIYSDSEQAYYDLSSDEPTKLKKYDINKYKTKTKI